MGLLMKGIAVIVLNYNTLTDRFVMAGFGGLICNFRCYIR